MMIMTMMESYQKHVESGVAMCCIWHRSSHMVCSRHSKITGVMDFSYSSMIMLVNMRGVSRLLACKARGCGFVCPIVLKVTNSKKLQRLNRIRHDSQPTRGRIQDPPLMQ